jgi:hypothetical protein
MVSPPGTSSSTYAPLNEQSRSGIIKYLNQGAPSVIRDRREDAYKQMYQACGGFYTIDAEGPKVEGGVVTSMPTGLVYAQTQYWYIQFSCVAHSQ